MPLSCTLDSAALLKILLHGAKYPAAPINGLLLGTATQSAGGTESAAETGDASLQIVDAVPLFHSFLHLSMPLETALLQVSQCGRIVQTKLLLLRCAAVAGPASHAWHHFSGVLLN